MPREFQYTATFTSTARIINPTERDRFIAKASLEPLRGLLPPGVNPEDNPDLLYIAAAGAVAGLKNRNDDAVSAQTALAIHKTCAAKYISTDHEKSHVVGVVLYPGLSRFGTNEPLTEEEAAQLNEPFNMAFAGVLWKTINPQLTRYIKRDEGSTDGDVLSFSWEIAFNEIEIGVGSKNLWDAKIVKADDPQFDSLQKRLRAKGGTGKNEAGEDIFRIITGDAVILGYSIVTNPAAHVKGILPITDVGTASVDTYVAPLEVPAPVVVEVPLEPAPIENASSSDASVVTPRLEEILITPSESRVTPNTSISMKIESADQLKTLWPELRKMETAEAAVNFVEALENANKDYASKIAAEKNLVQTLQQSEAAALQKSTQLEQSLAEVQNQLAQMRQAQAAAEANQKFQERMASLDESFDLDDEDRQLLAPEVRLCADDAAFAAFQKKQEKLMCGKKKGAKASVTAPVVAPAAAVVAPVAPVVPVVEAIASITPVPGQTVVPVGFGRVDETLKTQMATAFDDTIKVGGKTVGARRAEKIAAQPKE